MFGKSKVLIEGTKSQGVIFDTSEPRPTEGGGHTDTYHIKVRIKFGDGSTTDIKEKLHISKHGFHLKGQTVPVRYDPADHSKVEIDLPELAAQKQAARDRLDRSANARVEQALNEMTPHGGNTPPIPAAVTGDADSRRTILEVGIRVAQRRGDNAQVERLTAQLKQLDEGPMETPDAEPSDPLDRLQKLADLHDRGVLSESEFATEKAKILSGES